MSRDAPAGTRDSCSLGSLRLDSLPYRWSRPDMQAARCQADNRSGAEMHWAQRVAEDSRVGDNSVVAARLDSPAPAGPGSACGRADFAAGKRVAGVERIAGEVETSAAEGARLGSRRRRVRRAGPMLMLRAKTGPGWPQQEPPHATVPRSVSRSQSSPAPRAKKRNRSTAHNHASDSAHRLIEGGCRSLP